MGLLENATQAQQLHDEAVKAARIATNMTAWESRLQRAKAWWTESIGEPAEFFYPAGENGPDYRTKGVVAVCDGWSFYVDDENHEHGSYAKADGSLHAYLIRDMEIWDYGEPKPYRIRLWKAPSLHSDPPKLNSLADIGRWLAHATANGLEAPDPETLIWRKVKWS